MSAPVPEQRIVLLDEGIRIAESVRAVHWAHTSRLNNWIAGRGRPLVPSFAPLVEIDPGTSSSFFFRVRPSYQHVRLRIEVILSASGPATALVAVPDASSPWSTVQARGPSARPIVIEVDRKDRVDAEESFVVGIAVADGQFAVLVESISVEAYPRAFLDNDANDLGSDRMMFWPRTPISQRNFGDNLLAHQTVLKRSARRAMFHMSWGSASPWTTGSAGPTEVFGTGFGLIGRYLYEGETVRELACRVRGFCSDETTSAEVTIENTGGGSGVVISIPAGSIVPAWHPPLASAPATFECDAEDPSHEVGLRGGAVDLHQVSVERTAGSGTVSLESISIWESPDGVPPAPIFYRIVPTGDVRETPEGDPRIVF